jgi:hypothetical protein
MIATILKNEVVTAFTAGALVYLQSLKTTAGASDLIATDNFTYISTSKGFQISVTNAGGLYYFRAACANGTTLMSVQSTGLTQTAFSSAYLNKQTAIVWTFEAGVLKLYINGLIDNTATFAAASFIQSADGVVRLMGSGGVGTYPAGNKILRPFMLTRALTAAEIYALHLTYASKNQLGPYPYNFIEGSGDLRIEQDGGYVDSTFKQLEANASSIVYADAPANTNIEQFTYGGTTYDIFQANVSILDTLKSLEIENGQRFNLETKCSKYHTAAVKFKNRFGVWDYLLFKGKEKRDIKASGGGAGMFENADYAFGGDYNQKITLTAMVAKENKESILDLRRNKNVWFAQDWQFSNFYSILTTETNLDTPLLSNERLIRFEVTGVAALELERRFKVGDRITFEQVEVPFEMSAIWGEIIRVEAGLAVVRFFETSENSGLALIDSFVSTEKNVRICAFDAWELVQLVDVSDYSMNDGIISLNIELFGQTFLGYEY